MGTLRYAGSYLRSLRAVIYPINRTIEHSMARFFPAAYMDQATRGID